MDIEQKVLPETIKLGTCELDVPSGTIGDDHNFTKLNPKSVDVLIYLAEHCDSLVTIDQLMEAVWHGRVVTEAQISKHIGKIRQALGDSQHPHQFIETLPKRGYRLICDVQWSQATGIAKGNATGIVDARVKTHRIFRYIWGFTALVIVTAGLTVSYPKFSTSSSVPVVNAPLSIAILPFTSLSAGAEDGYFADGLTDEFLSVLAQVSGLNVAGRASTFYYKGTNQSSQEVGQALDVSYLLEGSVRRFGDQLRIFAQLVDVATGLAVWSTTYERSNQDIFSIQDNIVSEVTSALKLELLGDEAVVLKSHGTDNPLAQSQFLIAMGRLQEVSNGFFNIQMNPKPANLVKNMLEQVTRLDPDYVDAWAALVEVYLLLSSSALLDGEGLLIDGWQGLNLAQVSLTRAQELAPDAPPTLAALASFKDARHRRFGRQNVVEREEVFEAYERALQADPKNLITLHKSAQFHIRYGRIEQGIRIYDQLLALDPLSPAMLDRANAIGWIDPVESRELYKQIGEVHPNLPWQDGLALLEYQKGHLHHGIYLQNSIDTRDMSIYAAASLGDKEQARKLIEAERKAISSGSLPGYFNTMQSAVNRDYDSIIATIPQISPGAVNHLAFKATYRKRQFDIAVAHLPIYSASWARQLTSNAVFRGTGTSEVLDIAYAITQSGDAMQAAAIRAQLRLNMAEELTGEQSWHTRAQYEMDLYLLASEGRVNEALDAFEALYEEGWRWLMGPGQNMRALGPKIAYTGWWFEDNPILDSIRNEPRFIATLEKIKADNVAMLAELNSGLNLETILSEQW